jgi:hypothetical protein
MWTQQEQPESSWNTQALVIFLTLLDNDSLLDDPLFTIDGYAWNLWNATALLETSWSD